MTSLCCQEIKLLNRPQMTWYITCCDCVCVCVCVERLGDAKGVTGFTEESASQWTSEISIAFELVTDLLNGDVLNVMQSSLSEREALNGTCFCWPWCAFAWQPPACVAADARSLLESLMSGQ